MERTAHYGYFAERFGWTVDQVDAQPKWYTDRLAAFTNIMDEIKAEKERAANR